MIGRCCASELKPYCFGFQLSYSVINELHLWPLWKVVSKEGVEECQSRNPSETQTKRLLQKHVRYLWLILGYRLRLVEASLLNLLHISKGGVLLTPLCGLCMFVCVHLHSRVWCLCMCRCSCVRVHICIPGDDIWFFLCCSPLYFCLFNFETGLAL